MPHELQTSSTLRYEIANGANYRVLGVVLDDSVTFRGIARYDICPYLLEALCAGGQYACQTK
jgi:hypothetical protein